jgi:hypothetical protein
MKQGICPNLYMMKTSLINPVIPLRWHVLRFGHKHVVAAVVTHGGAEVEAVKGLYGSIKSALSFQVWIEKILKDLEYSKCDIARGVYLKTVQDDVVRILRHSDDFRISATDEHHLDERIELLRSQVRTTPFKHVTEFLGCQFTRYKATTMTEDPNGDILLVTMRGQIEKYDKDFGHLRSQFNPAAKVRYTPLPWIRMI